MNWATFWSTFAGVFAGSFLAEVIFRRSDDDEQEKC